jgi:hypothetical protein
MTIPRVLRNLSREEREEYIDNQIGLLEQKYPPEENEGNEFDNDNGVRFVCDGGEWKLAEVRIVTPEYFQNLDQEEIVAYINEKIQKFEQKYPPPGYKHQSIIDENGVQFYCDGNAWHFKV